MRIAPVLLAAPCAAALTLVVLRLPLRVLQDPNEGWNAYNTAAVWAGQGPYPPAASLMTNNYPPLSFYVVGALGRALGDNVIAGRLVSLASFLCIVIAIFGAARRLGCGATAAAFAALLFAAYMLLFSGYVAMDDPQLLGHALQMGALWLVLRRRRLSSDLLAAALLAGALFVKHNLIALPISLTFRLATYDLRRALMLAAMTAAGGLAGLLVFRWGFGIDLWTVLNSARLYRPAIALTASGEWLKLTAPMLAATLAMGVWGGRGGRFCGLYAVIGAALGAFMLGGEGVDVNAMFDADIAIAMGSGLALQKLAALAPRWAWAAPAASLALIAPLAFGAKDTAADWLKPSTWLEEPPSDVALARGDIDYVRRQPGPAICDTLLICYWAGKPAGADVYNLDEQFRAGTRDRRPFLQLIDRRAWGVIELDQLSDFDPVVVDVIQRNYRVDHVDDDGIFLAPR